MSDANAGDWREPFMDTVEAELAELDLKIRDLCISPANTMTPKSPKGGSLTRSPRKATQQMRVSAPTTQVLPIDIELERYRERKTNYSILPSRANASARIFKPQKLEHPLYKTERATIPVVLGHPRDLEQELADNCN